MFKLMELLCECALSGAIEKSAQSIPSIDVPLFKPITIGTCYSKLLGVAG
jgi:hypothetical protein